MCSAVGQLKVCVQCFKVIIFCVAKGKYCKPQKITHLLGFMERGKDVAMCGCALNSTHLSKGIYIEQWREWALKRSFSMNTMDLKKKSAYATRPCEFSVWAQFSKLGIFLSFLLSSATCRYVQRPRELNTLQFGKKTEHIICLTTRVLQTLAPPPNIGMQFNPLWHN